MSGKGFNQDGEKIEGFTVTCDKCGSKNVKVEYEFNYYGGYNSELERIIYIEKYKG